jgi:hypothetical protein
MGGFVPDCHTQTFVEVAKSEMRMFLILMLSAIAVVCAAYFCGLFLLFRFLTGPKSSRHVFFTSSASPTNLSKCDNLVRFETKHLGGRGARCSVYRSGRVNAMTYISAKGGCSISLAAFDALDFHAVHGGRWTRKNYNPDGSLKEVIDLIPTLTLPPKPMEPAQILRGSYGRF